MARRMNKIKYLKYAGIGILYASVLSAQGLVFVTQRDVVQLEQNVNDFLAFIPQIKAYERTFSDAVKAIEMSKKTLEDCFFEFCDHSTLINNAKILEKIVSDYQTMPELKKPPKYLADSAAVFLKELSGWSYEKEFYVSGKTTGFLLWRTTIPAHNEAWRVFPFSGKEEFIENRRGVINAETVPMDY